MARIDSYNNWLVGKKVTSYKVALKELEIQICAFENSGPSQILELNEYIFEAYWNNSDVFRESDLQPPDLAKLLNWADPDWEFPRTLYLIDHYISLVTNATPNALPILKDYFYHMAGIIKQAACEFRQTEKADFDPLNKFELAYDAIEHFIELTHREKL